ncbi:hypothetical protein [Mycobacterium sp.]|uniref:YncE family protein n=1 Tax=Mycobacterium sp. TaxID=1785 RepID=UPI002601455D|nr:hypothetical protein [Mycobacterium sp.]
MLLVLAVVTACASTTPRNSPPSVQPAQPADSPPVSGPPAGVVHPLSGRPQAAIFDRRTAALAVLVPGANPAAPPNLAVLSGGQPSPRIIALPGPASALAGDDAGTAYLSTRGGYFAVDLSDGHLARVGVDEAPNTAFTAITRRGDAAIVLGAGDGTVYLLAPGAAPARTKTDFAVDVLSTQGNTVVALDRAQTSLTTIGADGKVGQTLRAGLGATTMAADPAGRVLVVDTRGGELLVYGLDARASALILRQAYPVRQAPYGLAGSKRLVWVSQTAANRVIGYDLSTGIPVEKVRYPTVRQPNTLAVDEISDTLYVVSGCGAGVQVIEHAAGRR